MTMTEEIRDRLSGLAEEDYKAFNQKLLPGVKHILGVRLPALRKLAKETARGDFRAYLAEAQKEISGDSSFEEIMIQGLVIGYARMEQEEYRKYLGEFIPRITNWSVCDSFCSSLKGTKEYPEKMWPFLLECLQSGETYTIRFALVMMLQYYVSEKYRKQALDLLEHMRSGEYYVRMAAAWAVSIYYIHFPEEVMEWLEHCGLEEDVWRKALQKILESRRVSPEEKDKIRKLRARGRRQ